MNFLEKATSRLFNAIDGGGEKELRSASDQTPDEQKLCSFVKNFFEESRMMPTRVANEGIWMTNIAYLVGFDGVYYDPQTRQYRPTGKNSGNLKRSRIHSNRILPAAQNRLARLLKNPPKYDVKPNSQDTEDKEAARLGIDVINTIWEKQSINRKRIDHGMWLQQCGHAYFKISWDENLGDPMYDPDTDEIVGHSGDIRIDVVPAFEGFPDPLAKTMEECAKFGQAKVRKLEYFRDNYDKGDLVQEEGAWLLSAQYELRINNLTGVGQSGTGGSEPMKSAAIELSYYEKPSKKRPKGRHVIVANGVLLKDDDLPGGVIPFVKFDDIVVGGKFYSEAAITHARPLQDQYTNLLRKRTEWTNRLLAGKFMAARGHGLIQTAYNDQSGEVLEYDPVPNAPEPHHIQTPSMPEYAYKEEASLKTDIGDIFGLSEVSQGHLPSASIPAKGIELLLEQDETRVGIEVEQHEHAYAKLGEYILRFADEYCVYDTKLKVRSKNSQYSVKEFNGSMLRKNFDVTVIRGSTTPDSKVLKRQDIVNAFQLGLLGDPQDPTVREKVLGQMEFGDVAEMWQDYAVDSAQINRTLEQIKNGQKPVVNKMDNHALHILMKNRFRKTDAFEAMPPLNKKLVIDDILAHAQAGAEMQNPQLAQPPPILSQPPPPPMTDLSQAPQGPPGPMPGGPGPMPPGAPPGGPPLPPQGPMPPH